MLSFGSPFPSRALSLSRKVTEGRVHVEAENVIVIAGTLNGCQKGEAPHGKQILSETKTRRALDPFELLQPEPHLDRALVLKSIKIKSIRFYAINTDLMA